MPANEPIQNLPAPVQNDPPDGPTQIAAVNTAIATRLNMRFASVAARDAALPNPVDGMEATTGSGPSTVKWIYVNGEWRPQASAAVAGRRQSENSFVIDAGGVTVAEVGGLAWSYGGITTSGAGLKVPVAGLYAIDATLRWSASSSTDLIQLRLLQNAATITTGIAPQSDRYVTLATTYPLEAAAVVEAATYNSGAAVTMSANSGDPHLTVTLIART